MCIKWSGSGDEISDEILSCVRGYSIFSLLHLELVKEKYSVMKADRHNLHERLAVAS